MFKVIYLDKAENKSFINFSDNFKTKEEAIKYADEIKKYVIATFITKINEHNITYEILNINL